MDNKDFEVTAPPTDGVSCLAFSPTADILAVGSWDNNVSLLDYYSVEIH